MGEGSPVASAHAELLESLERYCTFPYHPGYAVVINGRWGSGKTDFIRRNAARLSGGRLNEDGEPFPPLIVSLYGLRDASQIDSAIFDQLHPLLAGKAAGLGGGLLKMALRGAVKYASGGFADAGDALSALSPRGLLKGAVDRVIVFDDLERAAMPPVEVLGYINPLVEAFDCRVIILADETQLSGASKDDYERRKEKTVGPTFAFEPDVDSAYQAFLEKIRDDSARAYLKSSADQIKCIFADSQSNNLRLLNQALWVFEILWKALTPEQQGNETAMDELSGLIVASTIELRGNTVPVDRFELFDEAEILVRHMNRKENPEDSPMEKAQARYPTVTFETSLLTASIITDIVVRSRADPTAIQACLNAHPYFAKPQTADNPSWRRLWHSFEMPESEQPSTVAQFNSDFDARAFHDRQVVYHVIGLGLWLSVLGISGWEPDGVDAKLRAYIEELYAQRSPSPDEVADDDSVDFHHGSYGLAYRQEENPLFGKLAAYERQVRRTWRQSAYQAAADHLRKLAATSSEEFLREVCVTNGGKATFAQIAVLKLIDPVEFAAFLVGSLRRDQSKIVMALSIRYDNAQSYPELREEREWLAALRREIERLAANLYPIARESLLSLVSHYLDPSNARLAESNPYESTPISELMNDVDDLPLDSD